MPTIQKFNFITSQGTISYIPCRLTEGKEWSISYYALCPISGKLKRKRLKINRFKKITDRRFFARQIMNEINIKLASGWNPFIENAAPKTYYKLQYALDTFFKYLEKEIEDTSIRKYSSMLKKMNYILEEKIQKKDMFCYEFTSKIASEIMLVLRTKENFSTKTYNDYLSFYKKTFKWLVSFNYLSKNPFENIDKISKKHSKSFKRPLFTPEMRKTLREHFSAENPRFLAMAMLCYYCFLRPNEISWLRGSDFNFKKQVIRVDGATAKNDKESFRTIPNVLMPILTSLDWQNIASTDFVFSADIKDAFSPGKKHLEPYNIAKYWDKHREKLGFGKEVQFYNLKHTGITDMLAAGVAPNFVQGQADHHSLEMTSIYAATFTPEGQAQIKAFNPDF